MHQRLKSRQNLNTKVPCTKEEQIMFLCEKDLMFICYTFGVSQNKHEIADLENTISRTSHFPTKQIAKQRSQHPKQFPLFFHRQNNFQTSKYPHIYFFKQISQSFPTFITSKTAPLGAGKLFTQLKYKTFEISICFFNINMYNSISVKQFKSYIGAFGKES